MLKPPLSTLVDIRIEYYIDDEDDETSDGRLAGLFHELEKVTGQNMVKTIELLILVWVHSGRYDYTRWGELDNVLMGSPESWPALMEVSLSFCLLMSSEYHMDKALRELPMTKLAESKQVKFDFKVNLFP